MRGRAEMVLQTLYSLSQSVAGRRSIEDNYPKEKSREILIGIPALFLGGMQVCFFVTAFKFARP